MSDSKWEPTDEMKQIGEKLLRNWYSATMHVPVQEAEQFLIAVQPLIEAEALERAAKLVDAFPWTERPWDIAAAIRAMIQNASKSEAIKEPGT